MLTGLGIIYTKIVVISNYACKYVYLKHNKEEMLVASWVRVWHADRLLGHIYKNSNYAYANML